VESDERLLRVTFELLGERLLAFVRLRIKNGEYTERGLARILGISQPQMHNVLKGVRGLRPALADRFLRKFGITALELLSDVELEDALSTRVRARMMTQTALRSTARTSDQTGGADAQGVDLRRWKKPVSRSARLNLRHSDKVS
jgi:plasmid maintenance system antidote protein VapI